MTRTRFEPLDREAFVFRLVELGSTFLPMGALLPLPEWFEPTTDDKDEGVRLGRPAGLSVWDKSLCSVGDAKAIRFYPGTPPDDVKAFGLRVGEVIRIGMRHERSLQVVSDPHPLEFLNGYEGHCRLEGLERPVGYPRPRHKELKVDLAGACEETF
jgi:hypothetical protein